jgi:hypothetical protein
MALASHSSSNVLPKSGSCSSGACVSFSFNVSKACSCAIPQWKVLDPGLRDSVHNVVQIGLGDRACPISYLCCTLLACEVGLVGIEGNYSSCTGVRFLG